jgi:hypothetical protein
MAVFLAPFILLLLFLVFERVRGKIYLARYERELIAKGEKLEPGELAVASEAGENGALLIAEAGTNLVKGIALPDNYPPAMKLLPSGRAVVCFLEPRWGDARSTNTWEEVRTDLEANRALLETAREALSKPVMDNHLDFSEGSKMHFTHLLPAKRLAQWFRPATQLALRQGNTRGALRELLTLIRLPKVLAQDRLVISELVRIAIAAIARTATWEALQAEGWSDQDLASIQAAWAEQEFASGMARALEGELVFQRVAFQGMRRSQAETIQALFWMEDFAPFADGDGSADGESTSSFPYGDEISRFFKRQVYVRVWRFAWLDQDERYSLEGGVGLLGIAREAAAGKSVADLEPAVTRLFEAHTARTMYDKLRFPEPQAVSSLARVVNRALGAETERSMTLCALALKRYQLRAGKYSDTLNALVPSLLPAVPTDRMDGKPLRYRLIADGQFLLYSVGEDGKDDGGDSSQDSGKGSLKRKDMVWPLPAGQEELLDYRARMDKP